MTAKSISELFDDPVPDPYPEFDVEVFELYLEDGIEASELPDEDEAVQYQKWLNSIKE